MNLKNIAARIFPFSGSVSTKALYRDDLSTLLKTNARGILDRGRVTSGEAWTRQLKSYDRAALAGNFGKMAAYLGGAGLVVGVLVSPLLGVALGGAAAFGAYAGLATRNPHPGDIG